MKFLLYEKEKKNIHRNNIYIILQNVSLTSFIVRPFNYHVVHIDTCEWGKEGSEIQLWVLGY